MALAAGVRVEKHDLFVRKCRLSMLAAIALDKGIIASRVVEGSFTRVMFLEYLCNNLVSPRSSPLALLSDT